MKPYEEIVFVSPGPSCQGGITAVVENLRASRFWDRHAAVHFGTSSDSVAPWLKHPYELWRLFAFAWLLLTAGPRVVSLHCSSGGSFYRKFPYLLLVRLLGRRVYLHVHPSHFWDFYRKGGGVRRSMVAFAFRLSAKVVFLTEDMKLKFSTLIPPGRCAVLPNPVRTGSFLFHTRPPMAGNCTLLFLGWIIPQKGVYDIVEVIPRVAERFPEVMFLFAGNKEVAKLTALLEERSLTRNARVLGWVAGEEKLNLLSASRLLLLPTYSEGIPNVILEAMASGLPAVTTAVGGIPSVFTEGENGYYVVPGDTNQLASTVIRLLQDDAECERLSRLTRQKVQRFYDSEVIGEQMETIYEA